MTITSLFHYLTFNVLTCKKAMSGSDKKRIIEAAGTVSAATLASRILGALRDMVIAWSFPAGVTDAFFVAFRLPNIMRRLFGEGALTVSILPVFTEVLHRDPEEARRVYRITTALLTIILAVVVVLGMVFARYIVLVFAPGFFDDPDKAELTISLTRLMFPFLLLVSLVALAQGVLNALGHFIAPAAAPAVLNVFMIGGAAWLSRTFEEPIYGLAVGVLAGGVAEVLMQVPFLARRGYRPGMIFNLTHPSVRKIFLLMGPAAFGMLVYQFNMLISTIFASLLPEGSISWLFYSQRFTEFPLGLFAVAIGTAVLPTLSRQATTKDYDGFKNSYRFALSMVLFLMLPCTIGLIVLATPIFSTFYRHGAFTNADTRMTAIALLAYAPGLLAIAGTRVTTPVFYSRQDTRTPVRIAAFAFGINLFASIILMGPHYVLDPLWRSLSITDPPGWYTNRLSYAGLGHVGLALATTLSSWYNFTALIVKLRKEIGPLGAREILRSLAKTFIACVPLAIVSAAIAWYGWADWSVGGISFKNLAILIASTLAGAGVFFAASYLMKQEEITALRDIIRRRHRPTEASPPGADDHSPPPIE